MVVFVIRITKMISFVKNMLRLQSGEVVELALQIFEEDNEQFYKVIIITTGIVITVIYYCLLLLFIFELKISL